MCTCNTGGIECSMVTDVPLAYSVQVVEAIIRIEKEILLQYHVWFYHFSDPLLE